MRAALRSRADRGRGFITKDVPDVPYDGHMAEIHFVRHGRTVLNELHRTQGAVDSPLTESGRRGAEICRDFLAHVPLTRTYLSPQGRVQETARILLEPHPDVVPVDLVGLREYNYGVYDGGPDGQMHAALPAAEFLPSVIAGTHPGAPEGITAMDYLADLGGVLARIMTYLRTVPTADGAYDEKVLVVSHGMTLMTIMSRWIGSEIYGMTPMANCSVTTVRVDPAAADGAPRLLEWARDPAGQGITFQVEDLTGVFAGVVPAPIDWGRPEGL